MNDIRAIGVGVIGAGWLGDVHARAWGRLRHHYPELDATPVFAAVADSAEGACKSAVRKHGFAVSYADWRDLLVDPSVDVVSVTAPNAVHREIGVAAAQAGKHVWIEKPVGLIPADAEAVNEAVKAAGVQATVGFNYRVVPAVAAARDLVKSGEIGRPTHARVRMITDYAAHPDAPLTWRYTLDQGGHGVLGDLASHAVDLLRHVVGEIDELVADTAIFLTDRPSDSGATGHYSIAAGGGPRGKVENEDYVSALLRINNGVLGQIECSRVAVGDQNQYVLEVHGTRGFVSWDFRTPGEMLVSSGDQYANQPARRQLVGPGAGDFGRFQPGAGNAMSYDDTKVIELAGLVRSIISGRAQGPSLDDAVASARVLSAMVNSTKFRSWVRVQT